MASLLRMPAISANVAEAVLNEWPLAENTAFAAGDPLATVETDKAVVDVPAEADGVLIRTLVEPGKAVTVGTPMAVLAAPGETIDDVDALVAQLLGTSVEGAARPGTPAATPSSTPTATPSSTPTARPSSTPAVGPSSASTAEPNGMPGGGPSGASAVGPGSAPSVAAPTSMPGAASVASSAADGAVRVFASPLARRLARENALRVEDINGTGPGGRIVRDDVHRAMADRVHVPSSGPEAEMAGFAPSGPVTSPEAVAPSAPAMGSVPGVTLAGTGEAAFEVIPHSRMRRAIAARLSASARETPVFTIRGSARVGALLALREELNAGGEVKISVNDLVVAAAARAHVAVPGMNVVWTDDAVRQFRHVDVCVAVATDGGLVTPVLRRASELTITALARTSADLVARARAGRLRQDELEGGTITVTNLGVYGTEEFSAVINPPQAAILAVGAAREEAVVIDGAVAVATVLRVTLSVDHRPVDGALAARWMAQFLGLLEAPIRILA
ncbi:2-oxo acid dehydrogenase subunit E2 [Actinoplanes sp. CA-142083]|uniref:dihydrolipoamide acetyltransferase family protein n=1 Tax=Actinoplanes sp. CA-142083 TaxID=3239903 RepID=UPI003D8A5B24